MAPKAFVLMPFAPEFDEIYNLFIADALTEAGFEVFRADDLRHQHNILKDIVQSVATVDLVVADLTGANPNVYYELGLAHGLRRRVVLLTQDVGSLPFDLRPYRVVPYNTHFAAIKKARTELITIAQGAFNDSIKFGSPITDFADEVLVSGAGVLMSQREPEFQEEGAPGFIDHLIQIEDGFAELTDIVNVVGAQTHAIAASTDIANAEIGKATSDGMAGYAKHIRKVARELGTQVEAYAREVSTANDRYTNILRTTGDSLEYIVEAHEPHTPEAKNQLETFLKSMSDMEASAMGSRRSFSGLANTMGQVNKFERHLDKAINHARNEVQRSVANIDQTIAMVSRARGIGERILRESNSEDPDVLSV